MAKSASKLDLAAALLDPASAFQQPRDVVTYPGLSREQRLALLEQWERDARALAVAEEEGMTGGEESLLARVQQALASLDAHRERRDIGTKHGG
jgi:hypothetical protein